MYKIARQEEKKTRDERALTLKSLCTVQHDVRMRKFWVVQTTDILYIYVVLCSPTQTSLHIHELRVSDILVDDDRRDVFASVWKEVHRQCKCFALFSQLAFAKHCKHTAHIVVFKLWWKYYIFMMQTYKHRARLKDATGPIKSKHMIYVHTQEKTCKVRGRLTRGAHEFH